MEKDEIKKSNRITIVLVVLLFVSPLFLSWYVFNHTDFLEARGTSNNGDLIVPVRPIGDLALIDPYNNERNDSIYGKWNLVYVTDSCDKQCEENIYIIRQTHLSMDKHSLRVQKVLLLTEQPIDQIKGMLTNFRGQQIINNANINVYDVLEKFRLNEADNPLKANRLYIVDPLGNLMMSYEPGINPRKIYKDLKKLLRGSRIG